MARMNHVDYIQAHWRTNATDTGLEWVKCGPECTHPVEDPIVYELCSVIVDADDIEWLA